MVPELECSDDEDLLHEGSQFSSVDDQNTDSISMPDSLVASIMLSDSLIAVGCMDHNVYIAGVDPSSRLSIVSILKGHADTVTDIAVNPSDSSFASASYDGTIRIWSSESWEELLVVEGPACGIEKVSWQSTMSILVAGCEDGSLWIWRLSGGIVSSANVCSGHTAEITGLLTRNDCVVSASLDGQLIIWDVSTGVCRIKTRPAGGSELHCMALHPLLGTVVVGSETGQLSVVTLEHGRVAGNISAHQSSIETSAFDPTGTYFASGSTDGSIQIRDAAKLLAAARHDIKVGQSAISTLSWHRSATTLLFAGTSDGKLQAYSPLSGECLLTLAAGESPILSMSLTIPSAHHCTVITSSDDGTLRSFDIETEDVE